MEAVNLSLDTEGELGAVIGPLLFWVIEWVPMMGGSNDTPKERWYAPTLRMRPGAFGEGVMGKEA
jgi:hypothetical protein